MKQIDFDKLFEETIPLENFELGWRFADENFGTLSIEILRQLRPLSVEASHKVYQILSKEIHADFPFKKDLFEEIKAITLSSENISAKELLLTFEIQNSEYVLLNWGINTSMMVPWGIFIEFYDSFYYPVSDDLTVINSKLEWGILFFHDDTIYFGRK